MTILETLRVWVFGRSRRYEEELAATKEAEQEHRDACKEAVARMNGHVDDSVVLVDEDGDEE